MTTNSSIGTLFVVVGPSGSGKDTVLNWLRRELKAHPDILFARRVVTRPTDANFEDHDTMTKDAFIAAEQKGAFTVTWEAHDLYYGIPNTVHEHLAAGHTAIVNGSRRALNDFERCFEQLCIVSLKVDREILAARLAGRNRQSDTNLASRLQQSALALRPTDNMITISNNGPVEEAGRAILTLIQEAQSRNAHAK